MNFLLYELDYLCSSVSYKLLFMDLKFYTIASGITLLITFINLPFGYIRSNSPPFSREKGRCIYIPILISIAVRKILSLNYLIIPFMVAGTIVGQIIGARMKKRKFIK